MSVRIDQQNGKNQLVTVTLRYFSYFTDHLETDLVSMSKIDLDFSFDFNFKLPKLVCFVVCLQVLFQKTKIAQRYYYHNSNFRSLFEEDKSTTVVIKATTITTTAIINIVRINFLVYFKLEFPINSFLLLLIFITLKSYLDYSILMDLISRLVYHYQLD